jgi:hypothetical protein
LAALVEAFQSLKKPLPSVLQASRGDSPLWVETVLAV